MLTARTLRRNSRKTGPVAMNLIADIMTDAAIYQDCKDIVYMIQAAALKVSIESITESMGSVLKRHSGKGREKTAQEVMLAWNAPPAYCQEADAIIQAATAKLGKSHCRTTREKRLAVWDTSRVVDRLMGQGKRLRSIHNVKPYEEPAQAAEQRGEEPATMEVGERRDIYRI